MTANLTFFLTTIIIRVFATHIDNDIIFPIPIFVLSYGLLFISLFYLFYCRDDAVKRRNLKENHFELLKERYKEILGDLELTTLSSDFDKSKENTTAYYIDKRMDLVTKLWGGCLAVIFISITIVFICSL